MSFTPVQWNAVSIGAWNRALITPQWVAMHIFGMREGEPVDIEFPVNFRAPERVVNNELAVTASPQVLEVSAKVSTYSKLHEARQCIVLALKELPKTPVSAAGFNLRFSSPDCPIDLAKTITSALDTNISDAGLTIERRVIQHAISFSGGQINLSISVDPEEGATLLFNFHKSSTSIDQLIAWLSTPIEEVETTVNNIIQHLPGVEI